MKVVQDAVEPLPPTVMAGAEQPLSLYAHAVAAQAETAVKVAMICSSQAVRIYKDTSENHALQVS